ncbi:MAG: sugar isomerase [Coxiella sp. RIFCSPHIGHO2_12_FULL_44_14]|nr:MAG: sugar isomerase [Coxiella sp. RIFCSPHIGHO2_12_FULL_44_14]
MLHCKTYFSQVSEICQQIHLESIEQIANELVELRRRAGRLFILGVGGSAANASHAVNDFRKLCHIEAYTPTDNVSELTARTNDEGWESVFVEWLKVSQLNQRDAVLVFSVGGGDEEKQVSVNVVQALKEAQARRARIYGIVGRVNGYTAQVAHHVVLIPQIDEKHITPHTEAFQALIWHCLVSHPKLQMNKTKW